MRFPIVTLTLTLTLVGCAQAFMPTDPESSQAELLREVPESTQDIAEEGTEFFGKFATNSAINSRRSFASTYYGEMRITLYKNTKVECNFWIEGWRDTEAISATAMLCSGRLQRDGTFEFQGVTIDDQTFTLRGERKEDFIEGDVILPEPFGNTLSIIEESAIPDTGEGVRFRSYASSVSNT